MARIHKLSPQLSNLIAAGEVVERPGSAVKELLENAIDAGATRITVEIKNGGTSYIRVTDNGSGILPEDVRTAFMRHATSKIREEGDLSAISTLGFRGEALAAIAAVSKVNIFTRTKHNHEGVQLVIEGGEEKSFTETGCPVGTTVVVRDLFFNTPARAKFLKKDSTEASYIEAAVTNAAISHTGISFKLIKDSREALFTPGDGKAISAIQAVCGKELASSLLSTAGSFGNIAIDGFVTPPTVNRGSRNMMFFFVNQRSVRSKTMASAVEQAYKSRLMAGRSPACFINLTLHPSAVDVNVHPAKLEVKFSHEKDVFTAVYHSVLSTLDAHDSISAQGREVRVTPLPPNDGETSYQQQIQVRKSGTTLTYEESQKGMSQKAASGLAIKYSLSRSPSPPPYLAPEIADEDFTAPYKTSPPAPTQEAIEEAFAESFEDIRVLGEVFHTYIIAENAAGVWIIDKHAAHERMLYNKLCQGMGDAESQLLLAPMTVNLSRQEKAAVMEDTEVLKAAGFEIDDFGESAVIVRQAPMYIDEKDIAFVISETAENLLSHKTSRSTALDDLLKSIACKAAIKGGQYNGDEEMRAFAVLVLSSPDIRHCPHGRPTVRLMTRRDFEKTFGRV